MVSSATACLIHLAFPFSLTFLNPLHQHLQAILGERHQIVVGPPHVVTQGQLALYAGAPAWVFFAVARASTCAVIAFSISR